MPFTIDDVTVLFSGTCNETSAKEFYCNCTLGWEGHHCERKTNYCHNNLCRNRGVCEPLFRNYTCRCLGDGFSGVHCEVIATKIVVYGIAAKSFAYLSILVITAFAMFIVTMDILKYCLGIDPPCEERKRIQGKKRVKKHQPVIQRFIYVHKPAIVSTTNETVV